MLLPEEERTPRFYPSDWRHLEFDSLLMKNTALAIRRRPLSDTNETDFVVVKDAMVFRRIDGDSIDGDAGAERILRRFRTGSPPAEIAKLVEALVALGDRLEHRKHKATP